ncbi:MAG: VOC family protein [Myxococcota bacterium]
MTEANAGGLSWGHVNLNVRDLERSIAFYAELGFGVFLPGIPYLGIQREGPPAEIPKDCAAALGLAPGTRANGCILGLPGGFPMLDLTAYARAASDTAGPAGDEGDRGAPGSAGWERICLATPDLAAEVDRLGAAGVRFLTAPADDPGGLARIAICLDPDGHRIELIQIAVERWTDPTSHS